MNSAAPSVSLGFVMLAHAEPKRVRDLAVYLAEYDCPVVVHLDRKMPESDRAWLTDACAKHPKIAFFSELDCDWGRWSLIDATQRAAEKLLAGFPEVTHVALISGDCLPIRPLDQLIGFLAAAPTTDFIESVTVADVPWTIGGLQKERFTLRFPFSWRKQRKLFDAYVEFQRWLKRERKIPDGLEPHIGSQWWCLTRRSLEAIFSDPRRAEFERYFKSVWIPDESYFQTLVRRVSTKIESRSLMLAKFDAKGRPYVLYDDHLDMLGRSDCFLARKVWPHANGLYDRLLNRDLGAPDMGPSDPHYIEQSFKDATSLGTEGRSGLFMQSRFPHDTWHAGKTAAPYYAFQGYDEVVADFSSWLTQRTGARVHGHLFGWGDVEFAEGAQVFNGGLTRDVSLRDYDFEGFLANLVWNTRGEQQAFQIAPYDRQEANTYMMWDPNAHIHIVTGAWALKLFHMGLPFKEARKEAAWMQTVEDHFLGQLRQRGLPSKLRITSLAEFIANPMVHLQEALDTMTPVAQRRLVEAPQLKDLTGFGTFLQDLKNSGMKPYLTGDFPTDTDDLFAAPRPSKPYLVT